MSRNLQIPYIHLILQVPCKLQRNNSLRPETYQEQNKQTNKQTSVNLRWTNLFICDYKTVESLEGIVVKLHEFPQKVETTLKDLFWLGLRIQDMF